MTLIEVKVYLVENHLSIAKVSRALCKREDTKASFKSMQTMVSDLIHGRRFYESLAKTLDTEFGIKIERPSSHN